MGTAPDLVVWAHTQLGVTEWPPGSNRVRYWNDVGMPGSMGQPWCAAYYLAGLLATKTKPLTRSVYVPTIVNAYRKAGRLFPVTQARPGDQVLYSFGAGHTGIVLGIDPVARLVVAIEGNTGSGDAGSQDDGGGVFLRQRSWSMVTGVGRPMFDNAPPPAQEVPAMFDPPIPLEPIVATRTCPTGGFWQLAVTGAVYAWEGAPFAGAPRGRPYFAGRHAARFDDLNPAEKAAGKIYVVLAREGGRYAFPE